MFVKNQESSSPIGHRLCSELHPKIAFKLFRNSASAPRTSEVILGEAERYLKGGKIAISPRTLRALSPRRAAKRSDIPRVRYFATSRAIDKRAQVNSPCAHPRAFAIVIAQGRSISVFAVSSFARECDCSREGSTWLSKSLALSIGAFAAFDRSARAKEEEDRAGEDGGGGGKGKRQSARH